MIGPNRLIELAKAYGWLRWAERMNYRTGERDIAFDKEKEEGERGMSDKTAEEREKEQQEIVDKHPCNVAKCQYFHGGLEELPRPGLSFRLRYLLCYLEPMVIRVGAGRPVICRHFEPEKSDLGTIARSSKEPILVQKRRRRHEPDSRQ